MNTSGDDLELKDRLTLIETMIAEGRRSTESWGWSFVLWGVAYFVAIVWAAWGRSLSLWGGNHLAWPVTMIAACILTAVIGMRMGRGNPETTMGRAAVSIWISVGISMLLVFPALSVAGRVDQHGFVALAASMLGLANGASALILRWKMQFACAVVWWATSVAACFGSEEQLTVLFLTALFLCQIVFGIYAMVCESRRRSRQGATHA
ncbi:MAG TPA: hypothetical protein VMA34_05440 [Terracidiphilus sp.]|nr:hypothetical protein [Terracidiphilus sp.]